jgi:hypothetical protein
MADAVAPVLAGPDLREALINLQRVAAGGDEIHDGIEICPRQRRERRGGSHLLEQVIRQERRAAGAAGHVLGQHVERAGAQRRRVLDAFRDRLMAA